MNSCDASSHSFRAPHKSDCIKVQGLVVAGGGGGGVGSGTV